MAAAILNSSRVIDYLHLAYDNLTHRKMRAFLTMLGIFIGVAAVVALVALGQGLSDSINSQFEKIGADKLIVVPGSGAGPGAALASKPLSDKDFSAVKRVRGVEKVGYMLTRSIQVRHWPKTAFAFVSGISTESESTGVVEEFRSLKVLEGRMLGSNDRLKALAGYGVARDGVYGPNGLKVNDIVTINGTGFRIAGILEKVGDPTVDGGFFIPGRDAKDLFLTDSYSNFVLKVERGVIPSQIAEAVSKALRHSRGVLEGKEDFRVQTAEQLISTFNTIFNVVQIIVIGIAAISLLVGGIGIMNTMYTSVLERTKEIGIMKAVGARDSDVLLLFLLESGMLGLAGGLVGVALGFLMAKAAEMAANRALGTGLLTAYFPLELIIGALLFSFTVGTASGLLPARQAARLRPVDALRYE